MLTRLIASNVTVLWPVAFHTRMAGRLQHQSFETGNCDIPVNTNQNVRNDAKEAHARAPYKKGCQN